MTARRRKRVWMDGRPRSPGRTAFFIALVASLIVVLVTILLGRLERAKSSVAPIQQLQSEGPAGGG